MNYSLATHLAMHDLINQNVKDLVDYQLPGVMVSPKEIEEAKQRLAADGLEGGSHKIVNLNTKDGAD